MPYGGPYDKGILLLGGSILGVPYFRKPPGLNGAWGLEGLRFCKYWDFNSIKAYWLAESTLAMDPEGPFAVRFWN